MIAHIEVAATPFGRIRRLKLLIDNGSITLGGNKKLRIYGKLNCRSGKRMRVENRVFFTAVQEALQHGYRPCGHCMRVEYVLWKAMQKGV